MSNPYDFSFCGTQMEKFESLQVLSNISPAVTMTEDIIKLQKANIFMSMRLVCCI